MKLTDFTVQDGKILLRPLTPEDQPHYHRIRFQHSMIYRVTCSYTEDNGQKWFHDDVLDNEDFFCAVIDLRNDLFVGYLGVHNMDREIWEISIELDKDYCNRGYGSRALLLFLNEIYRVTGHSEFRARVDADNIASQGCFEKIGARLVGICDGIVLKEEGEKERMEEEFSHLINDQLTALASRVGVEPRKLLSHVLEYRLTCPI